MSVKCNSFNLTRKFDSWEMLKEKSTTGDFEMVTFSNELNCDEELKS